MTGKKKTTTGTKKPPSKVTGQGGGGGGSGAGAVEIDVIDTCKALKQPTALKTPEAAVLAKVTTGAMLEVALNDSNGVITVVAKKGKETVGGIAPRDVHILIKCLEQGHEYVAMVMTKRGGGCQVVVQPAP